MFFAVVYFLLRLVLRLAPEGENRDREAEILVLRHQLKVLSRKAGRPKLRRLDRVLLAAFSRLLPRDRWSAFSVSPQTLLRWHRDLLRRKWTHKRNRGGRPPIDQKIQDLICRMAKENPRWGYMRIKGELQKLGVRVAANTIKAILSRAGLQPSDTPLLSPTAIQLLLEVSVPHQDHPVDRGLELGESARVRCSL